MANKHQDEINTVLNMYLRAHRKLAADTGKNQATTFTCDWFSVVLLVKPSGDAILVSTTSVSDLPLTAMSAMDSLLEDDSKFESLFSEVVNIMSEHRREE